jgi:hypothetical protein
MRHNSHTLIERWGACHLASPPFILPEDQPVLTSNVSQYRSYDEFIRSPTFGDKQDTSLHLGLIPLPYIGCLHKASVFILMLNPGLSPGDYFAEESVPGFGAAKIRNLRQNNDQDEFPFLGLNPRFAWHPGFEYWQSKFHDIAQAIVNKEGITYWDALKHLAQEVACLELMPYHSKSFRAGSLLKRLPSTRLVLEYVHEVLVSRAHSDDATLIVTRGARHWNISEHRNIIVYEGSETRSAHLTLRSRGGDAIARRLGL